MNAPDRYERFVVPEGVKKISYEKDPKVVNAATFVVQREDHTLGNLVRMKLLEDRKVIFAGYKVPHPLEYRMIYKVQTMDSKYKPSDAMKASLEGLAEEIFMIKTNFEMEETKINGGMPMS